MTWFRDLRIAFKLTAAFVFVVALTAAMGLASVGALSALFANTNELANSWLPSVKVASSLRYSITRFRMHEIKHVLANTPMEKQLVEEAKTHVWADAERAIEDYSRLIFVDQEREDFARFKEAWGRYQAVDGNLMALSRAGRRDQASALFEADGFRVYSDVINAIDRMVDYELAGGERAGLSSRVTYLRGRNLIVGTVIVCLLLGLLVALTVPRRIAAPLRSMAATADKLAHGDIEQQIAYAGSDEVAELAESLRGLIGYIKGIARACERLGGGDLTVDVVPQSDKDLLAKSFQSAIGSLQTTIRRITDTSVSLQSAAEELGSVSAQMGGNAEETSNQAGVVAAAADQVSKNVQTVATSAEEMSSSVKEVAKNAAEAARVAVSAVQVAERTNVIVTKLGGSSLEIGNVIKVITSIAEQTNLLALNATIEAARAGEAGKGFAVVANEVKELAKETAKATEDIGRKIQTIQADTKEAVDAIAQITSTIAQVSDIQNTIAGAVEEQAATTNEIGRNVAEAARASSDIAENIQGVAQAAHSTSTGATQSQGAAAELARMATEMQALVAQFDVGEMITGPPARSLVEPANENARPRRGQGKFAVA
jgi:methyl-accepting chemotaxis protein